MRVRRAWHSLRKRPYSICIVGITIWSFLTVAIFSPAPSGHSAEIISPRSRFCEAPQIEVTNSGAILRENDKLVYETFKRETRSLQAHLTIARSLISNESLYELQKHLSHSIKGHIRAVKIPKNEGTYVRYGKNKNGPTRILHYFLKGEDSHTGQHSLISDNFAKPVYIEEINEDEFADLKRDIKVLFTLEGQCGETIIEAIDSAEKTIDTAIYNFDNEKIAEALKRAAGRGLKRIRAYFDKKNELAERLKEKGVEVRYKPRKSGRMHDKFMIVDEETVFSGSYNWTEKAEGNRENIIVLPCPGPFMEEFEYIWEYSSNKKWPRRDRAPPDGIRLFFSPRDRCNEEIKKIISHAIKGKKKDSSSTIQIALYFFTDKEIAKELFEAKENGFNVEILLDKGQKPRNDSVVKYFKGLQKQSEKKGHPRKGRGSLTIRYHRIEGVIMHNKFALIGDTALTGSYNWTKSAWQKNNENLIVIPRAVKEYSNEFSRLWNEHGEEVSIDKGDYLEPPSRAPPAQYQYSHINPGPLSDESIYPDIRKCPAANFSGGKYNKIVLKEDIAVYKATCYEKEFSPWFMREKPSSEILARIDSAIRLRWLDYKTGWIDGLSIIDSIYKYRIPKGSIIYEGPVSYQGDCFAGGRDKMQIYIDKDTLKTAEIWDEVLQKWRPIKLTTSN
jgi:phosphatidylserine/phosphatidylglycerophosphate/cardiolipin synthase-like enzyme